MCNKVIVGENINSRFPIEMVQRGLIRKINSTGRSRQSTTPVEKRLASANCN